MNTVQLERRRLVPRRRADRWHRVSDRFGIVLVLLLATFVLLACGFESKWVRVAVVALQSATLLSVLAAARVSERVQRRAWVLCVCGALLATIGTIVSGQTTATSVAISILNGALVAVAPYVIATAIMRRRVIDARTAAGALCIYIFIGLTWAFVDIVIDALSDHGFFAQTAHATTADFLYFSFVTLTTVGYGDLSAATSVGRAFSVLEALLGQLYLVTVVAVIISKLGTHAEDTDDLA
jgi:hypothetical protein